MSERHPIIAITGSSGAGTTSVTRTFDAIFRRESVRAAVIEGDSFHRWDRLEMRMVAVLNGDMIGRNHPDTAALMGTQPPHRNSADLVRMAMDANAATARFVIDSTWDRPAHPEGWYFRSDHVPYAERGVPALFFSTNLHPDYHTPRDTPERINYAKLTRMTQWMYLTGWLAANADRRPAVDSAFVLR